jgi:hypothetical protein
VKTIDIYDWIKEREGIEETPGRTIQEQLAAFDNAASGVGLVFVLELISKETVDVKSLTESGTHQELRTVPVAKIRDKWVTIDNEEVANILYNMIEILVSSQNE